MNNVYGRPGPNSIWVTTALGDVYVFDPAIAEVKSVFITKYEITEKLSFVILIVLFFRNVNCPRTAIFKKLTSPVRMYHLKAFCKMVSVVVAL